MPMRAPVTIVRAPILKSAGRGELCQPAAAAGGLYFWLDGKRRGRMEYQTHGSAPNRRGSGRESTART